MMFNSFDGQMTTRVAPSSTQTDAELATTSVEFARSLLQRSQLDESRRELQRRTRLGALLADDMGRHLIFALTDEVLRITSVGLAAQRFSDVVGRYPTRSLGRVDSLLLRAGAFIAPRAPRLVMPLVVRRIRSETHGIVIPADDPQFARHLHERANNGVRINVNPLGEAILSDAEADERMRSVCERVDRSDVNYVSVKVSSIVANLDVLAFDHSTNRIAERLRVLYRRAESASPRTFVNLDMEEYRDLELTLQSFMRVLDEPEFADIDAGIVLQAYLPDSHDALERLGTWAQSRHTASGGTVKVRLVKGANLAMESVEAELHGWTAAPYPTKADVDASYKALLDAALRPEWADALRIGLASHNLFDIAWALTVGAATGTQDRIEFEMLEGMAPAQARALHQAAGDLLMYAPVVADDDFDASLAYLSRRLDENTQADNFLRSLFTLTPESPEFDRQAAMFRTAVDDRHSVTRGRRRAPHAVPATPSAFVAEPDSDVTDSAVRDAFMHAVASPPELEVTTMNLEDVEATVRRALSTFDAAEHSRSTRQRWLLDAAALMSRERADTLGLMATTVAENAPRGRPRGDRSHRLLSLLRNDGKQAAGRCGAFGSAGCGAWRRRGRRPMEFPVRDSDRRCRCGARGREQRDPQTGSRGHRHRCTDRRSVLACRSSTRRAAVGGVRRRDRSVAIW